MSVATTLSVVAVSVSHLGRGVNVAGMVADLQGAEHGGQNRGEQRSGQRSLQQVSWQVSNFPRRKFCVNRPFKTDPSEGSALDLPTHPTRPDLNKDQGVSSRFTH